MNVTREVILDLLPVYLAGEASPATRSLVEEYMKQDVELAQRVRSQWTENFAKLAPPPELELRSLRRTRRLLHAQWWLLGLGIGFLATALSFRFSYGDGHFDGPHLLFLDDPLAFIGCLAPGVACWIAYFIIRRRLRASAP